MLLVAQSRELLEVGPPVLVSEGGSALRRMQVQRALAMLMHKGLAHCGGRYIDLLATAGVLAS